MTTGLIAIALAIYFGLLRVAEEIKRIRDETVLHRR